MFESVNYLGLGHQKAPAARLRAERSEGKSPSRKEAREAAAKIKWTVNRLWQGDIGPKPDTKGFKTDRYRYAKFLQSPFGEKEPRAIAQIDVHRLRCLPAQCAGCGHGKVSQSVFSRTINYFPNGVPS